MRDVVPDWSDFMQWFWVPMCVWGLSVFARLDLFQHGCPSNELSASNERARVEVLGNSEGDLESAGSCARMAVFEPGGGTTLAHELVAREGLSRFSRTKRMLHSVQTTDTHVAPLITQATTAVYSYANRHTRLLGLTCTPRLRTGQVCVAHESGNNPGYSLQ